MHDEDARSSPAACPWCGAGTPLSLRSDGMGGEALWCTGCGCKGPSVPIRGDFDTVDAAAITRWSRRVVKPAAIEPGTVQRIVHQAKLHRVMYGDTSGEATPLYVELGDLRQLFRAAGLPAML